MKDGLPRNPPPPTRDRMSGKYFGQCPGCRNGRHVGPDCAGSGPESTRRRRKVEKAALRRYAAMAEEPEDAENEPDCRHGCNGLCELHGGDRCDFTCHPPFEEMFGDRYMTDAEKPLLAEDGITASFLIGESPEGFYRRLPGACSWVGHLPETAHAEMARECSQARDIPALTQLLTEWRHTAEVYADPELVRRLITAHNEGVVMSYKIDREANAMYIRLREGASHRTVELAPWLLVDVGGEEDPIGVELLTLDLRGATA